MKNKIVIICGPTGIGKTGFAIEIARRFNGEIIGADSMQIYKYMDIGTAKPDKSERELAPHHLIDFLEPDKEFDVGKYMETADAAINDISSRSKLPIVVGGTGFYIKALVHGLFRDRTVDADVIKRLEQEKDEKGSHILHERLALLDPEAAQRIHPNDSFRIVRALEVVEVTGNPISAFQKQHGFSSQRYIPLKIALYMDREELYQRIEQRVDIMIEQGFVDEVKSLINRGYGCDLKSMQSIGYRHICDFLCNSISWDETIRTLKRDTRRYAKRQLTWFRQDTDMIWLALDKTYQAEELIKRFIEL
ncbi:MAG: tRNA (adenosine(37)-N6)-dimethylallyltransferase MiaA [Desulfamplus sp.]|nr:tRNA (adenosine(37)-N6)-dimethylallyltransferase MiaA [Desulfamplus sp.]MBF0302963.1 tRNA (adenosine(37)-N6)-dimethylallyltransferase MiaA [Desulfamplus sp.]